ncbi:MAG: hypothetical protein SGI91_17265 [Alphaproteobacteria bacterium]|nr:hypothetical protein [Alphaproteobacteria bacterium]
MRKLVALLSIAASSLLPAAATADSTMPDGVFACQVLTVDRLTGTGSDRFAPSVLGTFSFDGLGRYTRLGKTGFVNVLGAEIKFVSGEAEGIVAVMKLDPRGRTYLHIDGEVTVAPAGDPKQADFVCYQQ